MNTRFTEHWIDIAPGKRVHARITGQGPDLLFLPGNGCTIEDLGPMGDRLAQNHRIIAVNPPGRTATRWPDEPFSFVDDLPPLIEQVIARLDVGPHIVIGHSMGGMLALQHAKRCRRLVRGIVTIEGFVTLDIHTRVVSHSGFRAVRMHDEVRIPFEQRMAREMKWRESHPIFHASFWASQKLHDARPWIASLGLPMLVLIGDLGQTMPCKPPPPLPDHANVWREHLGLNGVRDLEVLLVPDAGHWPMLDDPPAVGDAVVKFVTRVEAATPLTMGDA